MSDCTRISSEPLSIADSLLIDLKSEDGFVLMDAYLFNAQAAFPTLHAPFQYFL
jgi:hypothetical protein